MLRRVEAFVMLNPIVLRDIESRGGHILIVERLCRRLLNAG